MFTVIIRYIKQTLYLLKNKKGLLWGGIYLIGIWVSGSILFHFLEDVSLFDSFYWVITTTATVGYGDIVAKTVYGKIISAIVMLSGIGVLGIFLATGAEIMVERSMKGKQVKKNIRNHVIVCGWNNILQTAVRELLNQKKYVVIISDNDKISIEHKNLVHISGSPAEDEYLKKAKVNTAQYALILGKNDTETLLSAISVKKMNNSIYVCCIVNDHRIAQSLRKINVDQILSTEQMFGRVLSRFISVPKISEFLTELTSVEGMDLYQVPVPTLFYGKPFITVYQILKEKYNGILVGIVRNEKLIINPDGNTILDKNDEIIYIAENKILMLS